MGKHTRVNVYATLGLLALGIILTIMKISADSEPGAIPLLMILVGSGGYLLARESRSSQDKS